MSDAAPPPKSCGSCTFCCKVMEVDEVEAPVGVWCRHCKPGGGCGVHETRPDICRAFQCNWSRDPAMADSLRPDRAGVMLTNSSATLLMVHCDPDDPLAWTREPIHGLLRRRAREPMDGQRVTVAVRAGARLWWIGRDTDLALGEIDPRSPVNFEYQSDGGVRVRVLPPLDAEQMAAAMAPMLEEWRKGAKS